MPNLIRFDDEVDASAMEGGPVPGGTPKMTAFSNRHLPKKMLPRGMPD
jgi:hypothetical protein